MEALNRISQEKWTTGMRQVANFYKSLAPEVIDNPILVLIVNDSALQAEASYDKSGIFVLNQIKLGKQFFEDFPGNMEKVCDLFIHEMAVEFQGKSPKQENGILSRLGARLTNLALTKPHLFKKESWGSTRKSAKG